MQIHGEVRPCPVHLKHCRGRRQATGGYDLLEDRVDEPAVVVVFPKSFQGPGRVLVFQEGLELGPRGKPWRSSSCRWGSHMMEFREVIVGARYVGPCFRATALVSRFS